MKKMLINKKGYITSSEVLERLREENYPISAYTLYRLIEEGVIPKHMILVQESSK